MSLVTYHRADHSMHDIFAPLAENDGAGISLRYTATYDQIKEARRDDDHNLSRGIWKTEFKRADWVEVESVCTIALATQSKDLQVFGWLMESWLVMDGLKGGINGFQALKSFCEIFCPSCILSQMLMMMHVCLFLIGSIKRFMIVCCLSK
ncbi:MAG: type VI secretion system ImpA family N-terminal domain-containing protein [Alphaproteobacteria bacterium]|nr:type VI secretion system ImpA family N-terminal domain-containing protein [Alphaproteobacteria bacterium]